MDVRPASVEELVEALREAASAKRTIALTGANSKRLMGGPVANAEVKITTGGLGRLLQYEPKDLTVSVEAGMSWREFRELLAKNRQMVPLDPPFAGKATVGGLVAANTSGPRRRLFGTARDFIIGMEFITLAGRRVKSGGMVVKNVAGLDMAKLMIGSFGTLAAIASINFKVVPMPEGTRTFVFPEYRSLDGVLQPSAVDMLSADAARRVGLEQQSVMLVRVAGPAAVLERYGNEFAGAAVLEGEAEERVWRKVEEFTPEFLAERPEGAVLRYSTTLKDQRELLASLPGAVVARAGNGVTYAHFEDVAEATLRLQNHNTKLGPAVMEYGPQLARESLALWPSPGDDLGVMQKLKAMFDPGGLLNRGRLYGRI
jgi:glycolate oxidase FAD binding subunit